MHVAQIVRARHGVIHERRRHHLPAGVEVDVFHQRLARALSDAALNLAVQQHRVDHGADVVDHVVAHDIDDAGVHVDLEFAGVAAIGEILRVRLEHRGGGQARLHVLRNFRLIGGGDRDFLDRHGLIGLLRREHALGEIDVLRRQLESVRGDRARLLDHLGRGHLERGACHGGRARTAGAFAEEHGVGVALHVMDLLGVEAELLADDLLEGGFVALAAGHRAGIHRHTAAAVEADLGALGAG